MKKQGIEPHYFNVENENVAASLHTRMESQNMSTLRYDLPVVDVNATLAIRPTLASVQDKLNR